MEGGRNEIQTSNIQVMVAPGGGNSPIQQLPARRP